MPTRAELAVCDMSYRQSTSWTDELPVCRDSGVGTATNQIYRPDGHRSEGHLFEDCSCNVRVEVDNEPTCLYGVFDGHDGTQAANFALQRMAAEMLLDAQLLAKNTDEEVKEVLRQAFIAVEKSYWDSLDDKLAERTSVQCEIPEGLTAYEAYQKYPHLVDKLTHLNNLLLCGTTAVVALIHKNKLYVANVGDSRALLCRTDSDGVLRVVQLSVDHDLQNDDELLRFYKLGLNIDKIRQGTRLGNQGYTRIIGNYLVKGGYKDFEELAAAKCEPVTAEPDIHGGIPLDASCRFLILMSDGVYKTLEAATGSADSVNKDIAQRVVQQLRVQATLSGVAQAVVDEVVRMHHDVYMAGECSGVGVIDDMTLLVRNFNFPMPNSISGMTNSQVRFNPIVSTVSVETENEREYQHEMEEDSNEEEAISTRDTTDTSNTDTTDNSDAFNGGSGLAERIDPYVDFSEFYKNVEIARRNGTLPNSLR